VPFPTRDQLVQAWGDHIVGRLRPKAKALFQAGRFVGVDGDRAVFGLPNETHRTRCAEVQEEIGTELSEHFGRPVGLVLVVENGAGPDGADSRPGDADPVVPVSRSTAPPASSGPPPSGGRGRKGGGSGAPSSAGTAANPPEPDESEALSAFEESELGEVAHVDNSAEARVLQAFPGAEEVD
jgi:DNA polymerase-3 subunit gamma/tau